MKSLKLGIPYMGSKRAIASKLVDYILDHNPDFNYVYDLFGGGGAMSFEFLQRPQIKNVVYNELNTGVYELLKEIQKNGVTDKYYQWVDRDTFHAHKNDNGWLGGLCKCIWSFGNGQKNYLFGKDIEEYKCWYHLVVVDGIDKTKEMSEFCMEYVLKKYGVKQELILTMPLKKDYQERRLEIRQQLNVFEENCKVNQLRVLQQLQQLERLQQLEQLQQLERLQIQNKSYIDVEILTPIEKTIIYLDPPYEGTKGYQKKLCHNELKEYIKNSPYKIYVSSYDIDYLNCVLEINRTYVFKPGTKSSIEKLYCNRDEKTIIKSGFLSRKK